VTDQEKKPVLDEQTFERLLEAAYVLQEHNSKMRELEERMESQSARLREQESAIQAPLEEGRAKSEETARSDSDYTLTLAEIVEAQRQIQMHHLELDKAMAVVVERVAKITGASGAGIGLLEGRTVHYRAGAGAPALPLGSEAPLETSVCSASLRTGQVIRCEDVNLEFLFDPELCRHRGIVSLVAVPIYREGDIIGALELYFDKPRGFAEQDIHTCQLMAGLVTEAIGRDAQVTLKKSMAAERSTMLAAIERLQPSLAAWAEDEPAASASPSPTASTPAAAKSVCRKCGSKLLAEEQFCGKCGASRTSDSGLSSLQSNLASAWRMQPTEQDPVAAMLLGRSLSPTDMARVAGHKPEREADLEEESAGDHLPAPFSLPELQESNPLATRSLAASVSEEAMAASLPPELQLDESPVPEPSSSLVKHQGDVIWSSAARARDFLESLSATRSPNALNRFWRSRRGDFYLAIAVILVLVVIRWGIWSNHPVGATGRGTAVSGSANRGKQPAPDADLSTFDKILVGLGLAEAPETSSYKGNPYTQVWVDLHTALYYCPGSDLYGKTPQGKLTSQRDAQLDQFEPANRKACE
jgi:putative methionine-R-sulfoxide reductase with GAF domain/ribosomal protein L40E